MNDIDSNFTPSGMTILTGYRFLCDKPVSHSVKGIATSPHLSQGRTMGRGYAVRKGVGVTGYALNI